jgi:hypothetical protein
VELGHLLESFVVGELADEPSVSADVRLVRKQGQ